MLGPAGAGEGEPATPSGPRRRPRWPVVAGVLLGVIALWVALAGRLLISTAPPGPADAVFVLSGDGSGMRLQAGLEVMRDVEAPRLVVFAESRGPVYDPGDDALAYVTARGVLEEQISIVGPVTSTAEEASLAAGLIRRCGWREVIVVTSPYHTHRARWLFGRAVGDHAELRTVASDQPFRPWLWWIRSEDAEHVILEWVKWLTSARYVAGGPHPRDPGVPC